MDKNENEKYGIERYSQEEEDEMPQAQEDEPKKLAKSPEDMDEREQSTGSDVLDESQFLGTLMHASVEIWKQHILTDDYNTHVILNDFYEDIIDEVDNLVEGWMSHNGRPESLENILVVEDRNVVEYLEKLSDIVREGMDKFCEYSELKSECDDILKVMGSTIYKLKELVHLKENKNQMNGRVPSFGEYIKENR